MKQNSVHNNIKTLKKKVDAASSIISNLNNFSTTKFVYDTESEGFSMPSDGDRRSLGGPDENIFDDEEGMPPPVFA